MPAVENEGRPQKEQKHLGAEQGCSNSLQDDRIDLVSFCFPFDTLNFKKNPLIQSRTFPLLDSRSARATPKNGIPGPDSRRFFFSRLRE